MDVLERGGGIRVQDGFKGRRTGKGVWRGYIFYRILIELGKGRIGNGFGRNRVGEPTFIPIDLCNKVYSCYP